MTKLSVKTIVILIVTALCVSLFISTANAQDDQASLLLDLKKAGPGLWCTAMSERGSGRPSCSGSLERAGVRTPVAIHQVAVVALLAWVKIAVAAQTEARGFVAGTARDEGSIE